MHTRSVISDDFNADGRPDLLVTGVRREGNPFRKFSDLHVLENHWPESGNWIGVRLQEEPNCPSPIGAKITVSYGERNAVACIVTGDSYRAQHANMKHFGLGDAESVERITVSWPSGEEVRVENPAINAYHLVRAKRKSETAEDAEDAEEDEEKSLATDYTD